MIYEPEEDSFLLAEEVKKCCRDKDFLDMGAGSGILSETAMKNNARSVLAVDIQDDVIEYLKSKEIPCLKSDLFSNVKGKFDLIAFNPPYLPHDKREDKESAKATTGGEKGDEIVLRFLKNVKKHLKKKGIILLLLSSLTPKRKIIRILKDEGLDYKVIAEKKIFMEKLEVWKIEYSNQ